MYVPVVGSDTRTYAERWEDLAYLRSVVSGLSAPVVVGEMVEALRVMREKADKAESPQELAGYRECIQVLKTLMTKPAHAQTQIGMIRSAKAAQEEMGDGNG